MSCKKFTIQTATTLASQKLAEIVEYVNTEKTQWVNYYLPFYGVHIVNIFIELLDTTCNFWKVFKTS